MPAGWTFDFQLHPAIHPALCAGFFCLFIAAPDKPEAAVLGHAIL
jgi:hypothetical protein